MEKPTYEELAEQVKALQKKAEEELRQKQKEWEEIFQAIGHPALILDAGHNILKANRAALMAVGGSEEELLERKCYQVFHGSDVHPEGCPLKKMLLSGRLETIEMEIEALNGTFLVSCTPVLDEEGRLQKIIHIAMDISERKQAEKSLRESEEKFRFIFDSAVDGMLLADIETKMFYMGNKSICRMLGYNAEEITHIGVRDIHPPERLPIVIDYFENQARGEIEVAKDIPLKRKDGRVLYADVASSLVFLNERSYLLGIFRDITDRKKMEEARRRSEEKFSKAFRASPNWISISRLEDGRYIEVNDAFSKITGYTREEVIGHTSVEMDIWVDPEERRIMVRSLIESGSVSDLEVGFRTKTGEVLTVQRSAEKIILGEEVCLISVNHDITRHRHLEEQLRQSQKMEAIGRLAGGIAHDFNNILTAILGYSDLLLLNLKPREPMYNEIEEIRKAGQRAAALTQQLLAFSRKQILKQVPLNLNTLVNNLKNMLLRIIGEDIELVTVLAPDLGQIKSDWGQVEQVIMNLAVNARDAMTQGGKLVIETANIYLDQTFVRQHPGSTSGFSVMLTVRDTGCGMEPDVLPHIFEPFFTTKELGRGTGLGLSTVYGIVKQSGGYILAESIPGQGSTFKIFFPRIDQAQGPADRQDSSLLPPAESGVILVVEDDSLVRDLVRKILTMSGHLVLEAQNGEEAVRLCRDYEGRIDLLTTDVVMPGMNGPELSRRVLALRPEMKVLFMSGYSDNLFPQYGILYSGKNFIQKPFTPNDLTNKIREILS